jgi:hypothetical protein
MLKNNEELSAQITELQVRLAEKEKEISNNRKKESLTKEMTSKLDSVYNEFNVLQGKDAETGSAGKCIQIGKPRI